MHIHTWIFKIGVLAVALLLGVALAETKDIRMLPGGLSYSFIKAPYINPKIVQDLATWLSDKGDQVIAINLSDSQGSNRYFGEIQVRDGSEPHPFVYVGDSNKGFGYQYVGKTKSGLHVLYTSDWDGGSGVFKRLLLITFEYGKGIHVNWDESVIRSGEGRVLMLKRGEIGLGDRWEGKLTVDGNDLFIGKDNGWFTTSGGKGGGWLSYDRKDRTLQIELDR